MVESRVMMIFYVLLTCHECVYHYLLYSVLTVPATNVRYCIRDVKLGYFHDR